MLSNLYNIWMDEGAGGAMPPQTDPDKSPEQNVKDFESWLETQPAAVKGLYAAQVNNLKSALDKERQAAKENSKALKRLEELEAKEKERADAQLTKEQKLEREIAEAKAEAQNARLEANAKLLKSAVLLKAASMGFEHPADAFALADLSAVVANDAGEYDEKAIEAALKPLTGRLPVKAQGDRIGNPRLPQSAKPTESNVASKDFYQKSPRY